jgi:hypothetical protein
MREREYYHIENLINLDLVGQVGVLGGHREGVDPQGGRFVLDRDVALWVGRRPANDGGVHPQARIE